MLPQMCNTIMTWQVMLIVYIGQVSYHMNSSFLLSVAISRLQGLSNALKVCMAGCSPPGQTPPTQQWSVLFTGRCNYRSVYGEM